MVTLALSVWPPRRRPFPMCQPSRNWAGAGSGQGSRISPATLAAGRQLPELWRIVGHGGLSSSCRARSEDGGRDGIYRLSREAGHDVYTCSAVTPPSLCGWVWVGS